MVIDPQWSVARWTRYSIPSAGRCQHQALFLPQHGIELNVHYRYGYLVGLDVFLG